MLELCSSGYLVMSEGKQYSSEGVRDHVKVKSYRTVGSGAWNHGSHNSSEDPAIRPTQASKAVASNMRSHPQADSKHSTHFIADTPGKFAASNHIHNHVTNEKKSHDVASTNGKRRRSKEADDQDDVWTEHTSSSGRTYFYNKRLDKSQWECPKGMLKKAKTDSTPSNKNTVASTPASKSSHLHRDGWEGQREGSSSRGHREREGERNSRGSAGRRSDKDRTSGRVSQSEKHRGHDSRHHSRKSRSHSGSSSPPHSTKHSSKPLSNSVRGHASSGRSHSNSSDTQGHSNLERAVTGSPNSTPKSGGIQLISPTTPGSVTGHAPPFPASLSHALNTTQQIIDHTSLLLEQQHKLLAKDATPTSTAATPNLANQVYNAAAVGTPPTHQSQPLAKKKLSLTPQQMPHSKSQDTPTSLAAVLVGGATYPEGVVASPSANADGAGLHPLQRALLLQNQKVQHVPPSHVGAEPVLQTPPTAIPHHVTPLQSHTGSPIQAVVQSPNPITPIATGIPTYPMLQPLTPLQPTVFNIPANTPGVTFDLSAQPAQTLAAQVLSSKVLQTPMSKLSHPNGSPELCQFPDVGSLEALGPSQINLELVDGGLASVWTPQGEVLAKQFEQGQLDTKRRRTMDSFFLSGQVTKKQLFLASGQIKTISRNQRLRHLQALVLELEKR